tara:strand:+ start:2641 stop:2856 length:216 start_codon:yes stop_codon:yes gene_type:complete
MKRTSKKELNLNQFSHENDLNKLSTGCAPCLQEVIKIDRKINGKSLTEMKINEIKKIVGSIFNNFNDKKQI